ncbi:unnamed protein product, partial [Didymodactylos carnosus]
DRYDLSADDLKNLIQPNYELNDTILNAHLYLTAKLVQNTILFDSVGTHAFIQRGFAAKDIILSHNEWFKNNIVLFPIHHHQHWLMYIIDIQNKFIVEFDSALSNTFPKTKYIQSILKLLDVQHYLSFGRKIDFKQWSIARPKCFGQQDDTSSCGVHCALFARSYCTATRYPPITRKVIVQYRNLIAMDLIAHA